MLSPADATDTGCDVLADAALSVATAAGASWADVRIADNVHRYVSLRDGVLETAGSETDIRLGIRVVHHGAWGFAATSELTADGAAAAARRALSMAASTAPLSGAGVALAPETVQIGQWQTPHTIDPVTVPDADVVAVLSGWSSILSSAPGVDHTAASLTAAREDTFYADSAGSRTRQRRVRCHPEARATAVGATGFEDMSTTLPPMGRGWEYALEPGWVEEVTELPAWLSQKVTAPALAPGRYDLVIAPSNLWLTIHESVGHATEYDRAIGYEANYAGTSFATPDGLGSLEYGSPLMHITGDRTTPGALATTGWDAEGVPAQTWDLVTAGVLTGYQLDRRGAAQLGLSRSNGCAYADSGGHIQLQRMPNVSLAADPAGPELSGLVAGVTDGLLVVGDKSWSIDMSRRNFQFTAQRFFRIRAGRVVGQVKDIAYQSDTLDFWRSLIALGGPATYLLGGAVNCGKGQPGQVAAVSHGCPAAVFAGVNVLATGGAA